MHRTAECYNYKCKEKENCKELINKIVCFKRVNKEQAELMREIDKTRHPRFCNYCLEPMVRGKRQGKRIWVCTTCEKTYPREGRVSKNA